MDKSQIYQSPAANVEPWNRTLCSALEEMRKCYETRNFAALAGLIEEVQTYANRMEAKLSDVNDYENLKAAYKCLQKKIEALKKEEESYERK